MTLNLDGTNVSDDMLPELLTISGLSTLSLQDTKITGDSFPERVTGVSQLSVDSSGAAVTPPGGSQFSVDLSGAALSPQGFEALAKTNIPDLKLSRTGLNDQQLMLFAANDQINLLDVSQTKVTANGLIAFYEARKLRLAASRRPESLYVTSDFPNIAEQYLPDTMPGGMPAEEPSQEPADPGSQPPPGSEPPQ